MNDRTELIICLMMGFMMGVICFGIYIVFTTDGIVERCWDDRKYLKECMHENNLLADAYVDARQNYTSCMAALNITATAFKACEPYYELSESWRDIGKKCMIQLEDCKVQTGYR